MRILLTGATGYLGSRLAEAFVKKGYDVYAIKRRSSSLLRIESFLSKINLFDIEDYEKWEDLFTKKNIDVIVHTSTSYGRNSESVVEMLDSNILFPLALLEKADSSGIPLFINTDTSLNKYINQYSISKKQFLEWGRFFADNNNICFVNLRLEHFFGEGDSETKFTSFVIKSCLCNKDKIDLTLGEQKRDFIYIDDVISAYLMLLANNTKFNSGFFEFDIGSGAAVTVRNFVKIVRRLSDSSIKLNFGALPYRENELMYSQANPQRLQELGWKCRFSLEQGLVKTIEHYKKNV